MNTEDFQVALDQFRTSTGNMTEMCDYYYYDDNNSEPPEQVNKNCAMFQSSWLLRTDTKEALELNNEITTTNFASLINSIQLN